MTTTLTISAVAAAVGFLLGLKFKVSAVIAASAVVVLAALIAEGPNWMALLDADLSAGAVAVAAIVLEALAGALALQLGYLLGLCFWCRNWTFQKEE